MAEFDFDDAVYDDTADGGIYYDGGNQSYRGSSEHDSAEEDEDGELYDVVEDMSTFLCLLIFAGSLESAYSLIWGSHKIWGKGGGETLDLLW